jgi:hypothetical protein
MNITTPTGGGEVISSKEDLIVYMNQAGIYIEQQYDLPLSQKWDDNIYSFVRSEHNWLRFDRPRRMWFNGSSFVCEMRPFQDKHHRENGTGVVARWSSRYQQQEVTA